MLKFQYLLAKSVIYKTICIDSPCIVQTEEVPKITGSVLIDNENHSHLKQRRTSTSRNRRRQGYTLDIALI